MKKTILILALSSFLYQSCSDDKKANKENTEVNQEMTNDIDTAIINSVVSLTPLYDSPKFPDAKLTKKMVNQNKKRDKVTVDYNFMVKGYELGSQTSDAESKGLANSGKGQHIHFIVNNGPYSAYYMPGVSSELAPGNYVVLAFLSRSYHESVKSPNAYFVENLQVGDVPKEEVDLTQPHLFYSRPKGNYAGEDGKKILLDFYLLNTTLSPDGNSLKVSINDEDFLITEWTPYVIEGLPIGQNTIKLELVDAEGNLIEGPFNSVERTIEITE